MCSLEEQCDWEKIGDLGYKTKYGYNVALYQCNRCKSICIDAEKPCI